MLCLVAQSYLTLCDPTDNSPPGCSIHGDSPGKNTGLGCHALLQGILPTQGSNPGLPHCGWILCQLSHQGNPRILERVACPSPGDLPEPGIERRPPALQADSLPAELPGRVIISKTFLHLLIVHRAQTPKRTVKKASLLLLPLPFPSLPSPWSLGPWALLPTSERPAVGKGPLQLCSSP